MTRAPVADIPAPPFPRGARWINTAALRMDQQRGRPVLIEFWDFCRPNSLRTLPYLRAWDAKYRDAGLRVIGVHAPGFPPSADPDAVAAAVARLEVAYPVIVDSELELWRDYDNLGWPARYLFDTDGHLFEYHYGEGAYVETEQAIQELLGLSVDLVPALRPEDEPGAALAVQTDDVAGMYEGPYEAGAVWAVLDGAGTVLVGELAIDVPGPGAYVLVDHDSVSTAGELAWQLGPGVACLATCFTPGLAP